jgi:hypothetical protein
MTRPAERTRLPWLMIGYILGVASNNPGLAAVAYDLGRATRWLFGWLL